MHIYTIRRMQNGLVEKNYSWKSANSTTKLSSLEPEDALQSLLFDTLSIQQQCRGLVLQGSTEYNLKGHVFRAHPNYRQEGPWYDYAMITWGTSPTNNSSLLSDSCNLEGTLFDTAVYDKTLNPLDSLCLLHLRAFFVLSPHPIMLTYMSLSTLVMKNNQNRNLY